MASPEATEVEWRHVLLWPPTFHTCFFRPAWVWRNQSQPPTISLNSQQNEAQTCAIMRHTVKCIILHRDSKGDSRPRQQTAVPTPRCPDILVMCAAMTQHQWSKATPVHPRVLLARLSNATPRPIPLRPLESGSYISSSPASRWDRVEMHVLIRAYRLLCKRIERCLCCFSSRGELLADW